MLSSADSASNVVVLHPDSLIGQKIFITTMAVNPGKLPGAIFSMMGGQSALPFDEVVTELTICGILKQRDQFSSGFSRGGLIIPPITAERIPKPGFTSVMDLLNNKNEQGTYSSIQVRVDKMSRADVVKPALESMGVGVFSMADQLEEIKRNFMIFNGILGAIGTIALIVAGLGIANTMVMAILERKKEIGIMKAIGASDLNIKTIFFAEAAITGFMGALAGLALGWLVTRLANVVLNAQIGSDGSPPVDLFHFPLWLILGAIAFSVLVSLVAGLYPAIRASNIDPVQALRND